VLAEADLTMHLTELRPDKDAWKRAVDDLHDLLADHRRRYGPTSTLTLAVAVVYTWALASQGRVDEARAELSTLRPTLARYLGTQHPYYLRATYVEGLTYAQRKEYGRARELFELALAGQQTVLGPVHAHTLRTQYELAVALKFTSDSGGSARLMAEVRANAPKAVGWENDLAAQAFIANILLRLPMPLIKVITGFGRSGN